MQDVTKHVGVFFPVHSVDLFNVHDEIIVQFLSDVRRQRIQRQLQQLGHEMTEKFYNTFNRFETAHKGDDRTDGIS